MEGFKAIERRGRERRGREININRGLEMCTHLFINCTPLSHIHKCGPIHTINEWTLTNVHIYLCTKKKLTHIYIHIHTHTHTYIYIYIYSCVCVCLSVAGYISTHVHVYVCVRVCKCVRIQIRTAHRRKLLMSYHILIDYCQVLINICVRVCAYSNVCLSVCLSVCACFWMYTLVIVCTLETSHWNMTQFMIIYTHTIQPI